MYYTCKNYLNTVYIYWASQVALVVKNLPACRRQFRSLGWKDLLEKVWQPTPVFLPGESHGQRSLAGYGPQGLKELDMTDTTAHTYIYECSNM